MFAVKTSDDVLKLLRTSRVGLSDLEVLSRRTDAGFNELPEKHTSLFLVFLRQFQDILVYILLGALLLSTLKPFLEHGPLKLETFLEPIVIFAIIILNAILGFVQEFKTEQAIALLRKLSAPHVRVRRNGVEQIIPSRELIPGDIVIIEAGDRVSADGRLISVSHLEINESSLTGESLPVAKHIDAVNGEPALAEQTNMVFTGTAVTRGAGEYVVTTIGLQTELGKVATLVSETVLPQTPLQRRLLTLSRMIGVVVLALSGCFMLLQLFHKASFAESLILGASLAVSAVPEGLPAVVTACLAIGVRRMTKRNVLVRRLESLETLGSVTVICSDKTGTITENRMKVIETWLAPSWHNASDEPAHRKLLAQIAASCNRSSLPDLGDPTEIGLLSYSTAEDVERLPIDEEEVPFTSEEKYMQTRHGPHVFLKGAPERIVSMMHDNDVGATILQKNDEMASRGLRVLATAVREQGQVWIVGLIGMEDPPREGVKEAILQAKRAGIRTIMITGDSVRTAQAVAASVGITGDALEGSALLDMPLAELRKRVKTVSIFARVSPVDKLHILDALKQNGEIVAMSGDGVNDAPALKGAHVGVAMGRNGTEVARDAASIILTDDHFATIVSAIREGRHIYDNIRKFILCLLQTNFYELMFFISVVLLGLPIPYLPLHILWINLMTDGLPALALSVEAEEPDIMNRPPRSPDEHVLSGQWWRLAVATLLPFSIVLTLYIWNLNQGVPIKEVRSIVFTFAILFELLFVFSMRSRQTVWSIGLFTNKWLLGAIALPLFLQFFLLYSPVRHVFGLVPLRLEQLGFLLLLASSGLVFFETVKMIQPLFQTKGRKVRRA